MHPYTIGDGPMNNRMTEEYWSRFPDTYDRKQEYVVGRDLLVDIAEELNDLPDLGETVELGCGTGYFTAAIAEKSKNIVATDLSDSLLETTRKRFLGNQGITTQKENCMETSFASEKFDSAFMANLIHVVETPGKVLQECYRILKDGGVVIIVTFTNYGMTLWEKIKLGMRFLRAWGKPPAHAEAFSPEQLASLMKDNGFVIDKSKLIGNRTKALYLVGKKT
jgi:ABC-2 type transport system ATP-binding protein